MLDTYVLFQYSMPSSERASIVHTIPASQHRGIANALKGLQEFKSPQSWATAGI
jgi:hypothetical protein